ncbi:hypothetical protein ALC56_04321 [Trachymyrmex septentrionalis]|uniref:Uncharacterized protein n=1 Tax=Trachymyrmex septentrionalis TaxID=34720 RepID=A0A195FKH6_9HYME|nr:hypothetical protein ALC56_04321 [Trachymyrmex septentrionalis]
MKASRPIESAGHPGALSRSGAVGEPAHARFYLQPVPSCPSSRLYPSIKMLECETHKKLCVVIA